MFLRVVLSACVGLTTLVWAVRLPSGHREAQAGGLPCPELPRPPYTHYAHMARWIVHQTDWGVVSTTSRHLGGAAFGNVVSHADGPRCQPTGRLLFYLTIMDATAQDLERNSNASLTLSEGQLAGACQGVDPEDPTCAKLSISGSLELVPEEGVEEARRLLFSRHPQMEDWPAGHAFRLYELHMTTARLLDWYGGPHDISPAEYSAAELATAGSAAELATAGRIASAATTSTAAAAAA